MRYTDRDRYSKDQRFEIVLDNGEDPTKWSDMFDTVANVASGTEHITGSRSISFDKAAGSTPDAYIIRPISQKSGYNLDSFSSEGQILSSVYLSSISDVSSCNVALLMSSGTENGTFYSISDTDLSTGWNHLKFDCSDYTTQSGCGTDWHSVKWLAFGVSFDNASDTLSDILVDSVRLQIPTAIFNFDPNIDNVTMQSEVQIKNGNDSDELSVDAANTSRTTATNVIPVQEVDATGKVSPAGEAVGNAPFTKLTDGTNVAGIDEADTARSTSTVVQTTQNVDATGKVAPAGEANNNSPFVKITDGSDNLDLQTAGDGVDTNTTVVPVQSIDSTGKVTPAGETNSNAPYVQVTDGSNEITLDDADTARTTSTKVIPVQHIDDEGKVLKSGADSDSPVYTQDVGGGSGGGGGNMLYISPEDFSATYTTSSGITLDGLSWVPTIEQFVGVTQFNSDGLAASLTPSTNDFDYDSSTGVLNLGGSPGFAATDQGYRVQIYGPDKAFNQPTDSNKTIVLNPLNEQNDFETVAGVTNEADATTEYYVSTANYAKTTIEFYQTGGTDTLHLRVFGTLQDDDTAAASCRYVDITENGLDWMHTDTPAAVITTSGIVCTKEGSGYKYLELEVAKSGSADDADYEIYVKKHQ